MAVFFVLMISRVQWNYYCCCRNTACGCAMSLAWRRTAESCTLSRRCICANLKFCREKKGRSHLFVSIYKHLTYATSTVCDLVW